MSETISVHNMFSPGLSLEFSCIELSMNNLSSYCGLVDAKIRAPDKDLPVQYSITYTQRRIRPKYNVFSVTSVLIQALNVIGYI